ncbi:MAG: Smr/MutS family protein [Spirochaetia bacterium]|nr:Smr/MutS family protein [Spirochaetia bacterium]
MDKIYIRKLRFQEAKEKFLREVEKAFINGIKEIEVIHGIGTYTLRKMVIEEVSKLDYADIDNSNIFFSNPGSLRLLLFPPESHLLNKYIEK